MPELTPVGVGIGLCQQDEREHSSLHSEGGKHMGGLQLCLLGCGSWWANFCQLQNLPCLTRKGPEDSFQLAIYCTEASMGTREGK